MLKGMAVDIAAGDVKVFKKKKKKKSNKKKANPRL